MLCLELPESTCKLLRSPLSGLHVDLGDEGYLENKTIVKICAIFLYSPPTPDKHDKVAGQHSTSAPNKPSAPWLCKSPGIYSYFRSRSPYSHRHWWRCIHSRMRGCGRGTAKHDAGSAASSPIGVCLLWSSTWRQAAFTSAFLHKLPACPSGPCTQCQPISIT